MKLPPAASYRAGRRKVMCFCRIEGEMAQRTVRPALALSRDSLWRPDALDFRTSAEFVDRHMGQADCCALAGALRDAGCPLFVRNHRNPRLRSICFGGRRRDTQSARILLINEFTERLSSAAAFTNSSRTPTLSRTLKLCESNSLICDLICG